MIVNTLIPRRRFLAGAAAAAGDLVGRRSAQAQGTSNAPAGRSPRGARRHDPQERQDRHRRCGLHDRAIGRRRGRPHLGGRSRRRHGGARGPDDAHRRSEGQDGRSRPDRRPRPHGPRGAAQRLPVARARPLDPRHPGPDRRARARQAAGRMDRDHADRRSALLLRRARDPRREALADPPGARRGRARQSGLHPRDLGILARHLSAGVMRQQRGAQARRHHARHRFAGRHAHHRQGRATATRPACSSSANSRRSPS